MTIGCNNKYFLIRLNKIFTLLSIASFIRGRKSVQVENRIDIRILYYNITVLRENSQEHIRGVVFL